MGTDSRPAVEIPAHIAEDRDFLDSSANNRSGPRLNLVSRRDFTSGQPVGVLDRDIEILSREFGSGSKGNARRIVESFPGVFSSLNHVRQEDTGNGSVGHALPGISGGDVYIRLVLRVAPYEGQVIYRLHDLAGPSELDSFNHRKSSAGPFFKVSPTLCSVVCLPGLVVFASNNKEII